MSIICLRYYPRHQRAQQTIQKYLYQAIDQELATSEDSRRQRKKISFIASLVDSLQKDEKVESMKSDEEQQGENFILEYYNVDYILFY
jgi:hypothetical protein